MKVEWSIYFSRIRNFVDFYKMQKNVIIPGLKQKRRNYIHVDMQIQVLYKHTYLKIRIFYRSKVPE